MVDKGVTATMESADEQTVAVEKEGKTVVTHPFVHMSLDLFHCFKALCVPLDPDQCGQQLAARPMSGGTCIPPVVDVAGHLGSLVGAQVSVTRQLVDNLRDHFRGEDLVEGGARDKAVVCRVEIDFGILQLLPDDVDDAVCCYQFVNFEVLAVGMMTAAICCFAPVFNLLDPFAVIYHEIVYPQRSCGFRLSGLGC
jgi:hypothetical protein